MKTKKTPAAFHRRIFGEAWLLARQRRPLWVFGLFAGVLLSGAAIEPVFSYLGRIVHLGAFWTMRNAEMWSEAMLPMGRAISHACRVNPLIAQASLTVLILVAIFSLAFALTCQGGLIAGLMEKKPSPFSHLLSRGWEKAWELFVLNALSRAFQFVLLLIIALPLVLYTEDHGWTMSFIASLSLLLYTPLAIAGNAIMMLACIHAVKKDTDVPTSIQKAFHLFFLHGLSAFETAMLLFVLGGLGTLVFAAAVLLAFIPAFLAMALAISSGWFIGMGLVGAMGILAFCAALFAFFGALNTFRYAVWFRFYERISHPLTGRTVVAKLRRWFHPKHIR